MNHLYPDYDPSTVRPRHRQTTNLASGSPAHAPHSQSHSQAPPSDAIPDMGILKALQGVGEGVRLQLNQLAVQFNQTATAALETIEGKRSRSTSFSGSSGGSGESSSGEMRPLTATDYEEEDEDEPLMSSSASSPAFSSYSQNSNLTRRPAKKDK
jgi:hypothetical protein